MSFRFFCHQSGMFILYILFCLLLYSFFVVQHTQRPGSLLCNSGLLFHMFSYCAPTKANVTACWYCVTCSGSPTKGTNSQQFGILSNTNAGPGTFGDRSAPKLQYWLGRRSCHKYQRTSFQGSAIQLQFVVALPFLPPTWTSHLAWAEPFSHPQGLRASLLYIQDPFLVLLLVTRPEINGIERMRAERNEGAKSGSESSVTHGQTNWHDTKALHWNDI